MTETDNRNTITDAIDDLKNMLDKHDSLAELATPPLMQHFGRLCRRMDIALIELGWKEVKAPTETNEQTHDDINKRIAGCLSVLVRNIGDPMTIDFGILSTLSYSFKEQLLKEMREALQ